MAPQNYIDNYVPFSTTPSIANMNQNFDRSLMRLGIPPTSSLQEGNRDGEGDSEGDDDGQGRNTPAPVSTSAASAKDDVGVGVTNNGPIMGFFTATALPPRIRSDLEEDIFPNRRGDDGTVTASASENGSEGRGVSSATMFEDEGNTSLSLRLRGMRWVNDDAAAAAGTGGKRIYENRVDSGRVGKSERQDRSRIDRDQVKGRGNDLPRPLILPLVVPTATKTSSKKTEGRKQVLAAMKKMAIEAAAEKDRAEVQAPKEPQPKQYIRLRMGLGPPPPEDSTDNATSKRENKDKNRMVSDTTASVPAEDAAVVNNAPQATENPAVAGPSRTTRSQRSRSTTIAASLSKRNRQPKPTPKPAKNPASKRATRSSAKDSTALLTSPILREDKRLHSTSQYSDTFYVDEDNVLHLGLLYQIPLSRPPPPLPEDAPIEDVLRREGPRAAWERLFPGEGKLSEYPAQVWNEKMIREDGIWRIRTELDEKFVPFGG